VQDAKQIGDPSPMAVQSQQPSQPSKLLKFHIAKVIAEENREIKSR
jgi:hypothetical protein